MTATVAVIPAAARLVLRLSHDGVEDPERWPFTHPSQDAGEPLFLVRPGHAVEQAVGHTITSPGSNDVPDDDIHLLHDPCGQGVERITSTSRPRNETTVPIHLRNAATGELIDHDGVGRQRSLPSTA